MDDRLNDTAGLITDKMAKAARKAWAALADYRFSEFGHQAGRWIALNQLLPRLERQPNPFREAVILARKQID